ncbi:MAG: hypothetical protein HYY24_20655 [Verrucomicrobia bacterium]|nr:hypothetical protein [Verrucomicrobiota bacterium]
MIHEQQLLEKLRLIEALHAGAATEGERVAAANARERILERLRKVERTDPPVEFRFSARNEWSLRLLVALMRRYQLRPYRYPRQRRTTVMARVPRQFVDETLWPEFCEIDRTLRSYLDEVTARVIGEAITADDSDVEVRPEPAALGPGNAAFSLEIGDGHPG